MGAHGIPVLAVRPLVYMDDVLIFSETIEEHLRHLELVFQRLKQYDLFCRPHKCTFHRPEIKFLGFIVGGGRQRVDPETTRAVQEWPPPREATHVRQFIGLVNHCRKYIRGLASIALPMTRLMSEKEPFLWGADQQQAFQTLNPFATNSTYMSSPGGAGGTLLLTRRDSAPGPETPSGPSA